MKFFILLTIAFLLFSCNKEKQLLTGRVLIEFPESGKQEAVKGASVDIYNKQNASFYTDSYKDTPALFNSITNSRGKYRIEGIVAGQYSVVISATYNGEVLTQVQEIILDRDSRYECDFIRSHKGKTRILRSSF